MYTATVQITIPTNTFVPLGQGGKPFSAPLAPPVNTSPKGSGGSNVFSGDGQSITIKGPPGYTGAVQLTFQLYSSDYLLAGIAVDSKQTQSVGAPSTGRTQFRTVIINR